MSRAAVYNLLSSDSTLHTLGFPASSFFASNSADDPPSKFVVVRWEDMPATGFGKDRTFGPQNLQVWVHDTDRTYDTVNAALLRVKALLDAATHLPGADGWTLTCCDWQGDSGDLWDDGYGTVTRNTSYRVASRPS